MQVRQYNALIRRLSRTITLNHSKYIWHTCRIWHTSPDMKSNVFINCNNDNVLIIHTVLWNMYIPFWTYWYTLNHIEYSPYRIYRGKERWQRIGWEVENLGKEIPSRTFQHRNSLVDSMHTHLHIIHLLSRHSSRAVV